MYIKQILAKSVLCVKQILVKSVLCVKQILVKSVLSIKHNIGIIGFVYEIFCMLIGVRGIVEVVEMFIANERFLVKLFNENE